VARGVEHERDDAGVCDSPSDEAVQGRRRRRFRQLEETGLDGDVGRLANDQVAELEKLRSAGDRSAAVPNEQEALAVGGPVLNMRLIQSARILPTEVASGR
jgi:hypothetical protein